jgi:uncharacterized protein (DUF305 family)
MHPKSLLRLAGVAFALVASVGGAQSPRHATRPATRPATPPANAADVAFMRDMIGHHAQAVEMVALLKTRTRRDDMRLLGERIDVSQRDEMASMRRWLQRHGVPLPDTAHAPMGHDMSHDMAAHDSLMPGMLTPAEMARLARATGPEFDRLFLAGMIRHHEGALTMVKALFARPGAAQDAEIYTFASDVDADQRAEIARMRALERTLPPAPNGSH